MKTKMNEEYIVENCKDKINCLGVDFCFLQTIPCKALVEKGNCPKILWPGKFDLADNKTNKVTGCGHCMGATFGDCEKCNKGV